MFCNACGQPLAPGATACAHCGQPNLVPPAHTPYPMSSPFAVVEGRIHALAYGWLVYAGLEACAGFAGLLIARTFLGMHLNQGWGNTMGLGAHLPFVILRFAWIAIVVRVALSALSGYGLLQKPAWARPVAIVAAILGLIHPILGTAMGIWTLIVLLNRENAAGYDAMIQP